jgi:hypothetical protein
MGLACTPRSARAVKARAALDGKGMDEWVHDLLCGVVDRGDLMMHDPSPQLAQAS